MATRDHNLIWESLTTHTQITNEETPDMVDSGPAPKTLQDAVQRLSGLDIDGLEDGEGKDEALRFLFAAIEVIEDEIAYQAKVKGGAPDVNSAFGKPSFAGADQHAQESDEGYEEGTGSGHEHDPATIKQREKDRAKLRKDNPQLAYQRAMTKKKMGLELKSWDKEALKNAGH